MAILSSAIQSRAMLPKRYNSIYFCKLFLLMLVFLSTFLLQPVFIHAQFNSEVSSGFGNSQSDSLDRNQPPSATTAFPELARMRTLAKSTVFNLTVGVVVSDRNIIENFLIPFFRELNNEAPVASRPTVKLRPIFDQPDLPTKSANPIEAVLKICER